MILNADCIRNLMLYLEENTTVQQGGSVVHSYWQFSPLKVLQIYKGSALEYTPEEFYYHLIQLSESGYIVSDYSFDRHNETGAFNLGFVYCLTPKGHELAASLRNEESWKNKIKPALKSLGGISLAILEKLALSLINPS